MVFVPIVTASLVYTVYLLDTAKLQVGDTFLSAK